MINTLNILLLIIQSYLYMDFWWSQCIPYSAVFVIFFFRYQGVIEWCGKLIKIPLSIYDFPSIWYALQWIKFLFLLKQIIIALYCLFCIYSYTLVCLIIVGSNNSGQWPKSPKPNNSGQLTLIVLVPNKHVLRAKTENLIIMAHDY